MNIFEAALLGIVQGLTEFLPVSSSGHLILFRNLLDLQPSFIAFDIAVHWGTLVAVIIYFRKDVVNILIDSLHVCVRPLKGESVRKLLITFPGAQVGIYILFASFATLGLMLVFKPYLEKAVGSLLVTAISWICMGAVLIYSSSRAREKVLNIERMLIWHVLIIGLAQGIAILPGISRSGMTICAAMLMGVQREEAARFSFLLGIPAIIGAGAYKAGAVIELWQSHQGAFIAGFSTALIVGFFAIIFLLKVLEKDKLHLFGFYCLALGFFSLLYRTLA